MQILERRLDTVRWLAYYCTRIFEGAILVNHGQCLLVNCTEIYPRLPCLDGHFERFKQVHQRSPASSIPEDDAQYPDVQVCVMENDNTNKLVIGTKSFNALLTSTIRLDVDHIPTIGASSINGFSPTKTTRIYLDQRVVKMLNEWVEKKKIEKNAGTALVNYPLCVFDELTQLRQVRPKFNDPSTYQFLRRYSSVTNDLRLRPITVWTLADTSPTNDTTSDGRTASLLFRTIAIKVWEAEKLDLASVTAIQINLEFKIGKLLIIVRNLFQENQETISIIGNKALNTVLTSMANVMGPYINSVNKEAALSIYDTLLKKRK